MDLSIGLTGTAEMVVGTNDTAPRVGSGKIAVLATPVMISLMEEAALAAIETHLPTGMQSLGTRLNVSHIAATPIGMRVVATATLTRSLGRKLELTVTARDELELIGEGTHERVLVDVERFQVRINQKSTR